MKAAWDGGNAARALIVVGITTVTSLTLHAAMRRPPKVLSLSILSSSLLLILNL
jgi:hypothetical protein